MLYHGGSLSTNCYLFIEKSFVVIYYLVDTEFSLVFQYNFINPIIAIVISVYCLIISYLYTKALWIKNYKIWSKVVMIFTIVSTILLLPIII